LHYLLIVRRESSALNVYQDIFIYKNNEVILKDLGITHYRKIPGHSSL